MGDGVPNSLHQSDWWSARQRRSTSGVKEWNCEYLINTFLYEMPFEVGVILTN